MSKRTVCDKCDAIVPAWNEGKGHDGMDRKIRLQLGNNSIEGDLCDNCYREAFAAFRQFMPKHLKQLELVEPPRQLKPT